MPTGRARKERQIERGRALPDRESPCSLEQAASRGGECRRDEREKSVRSSEGGLCPTERVHAALSRRRVAEANADGTSAKRASDRARAGFARPRESMQP